MLLLPYNIATVFIGQVWASKYSSYVCVEKSAAKNFDSDWPCIQMHLYMCVYACVNVQLLIIIMHVIVYI